jgi:uncharacterized membrane protein
MKIKFWIRWVLFSTLVIPISFLLSLFASVLVHGAFGFTMKEDGTIFSQTLGQMAGGAVIGLGTGIYQEILLRKLFKVKTSWIYSLIISFVIAELVAGIILKMMGLVRIELRFLEHNPLPEALIFAWIGLLTGFSQWLILKKTFSKSYYWMIASMAGWGICFLMMAYTYVFPEFLMSTSILPAYCFFSLGSFLYGVITGTTLTLFTKYKGNVENTGNQAGQS